LRWPLREAARFLHGGMGISCYRSWFERAAGRTRRRPAPSGGAMNLFANPIPRITSILLALGVSNVSAAGINLSWNDCGRAGAQNQAFDCASNSSAPFSIVASYVAPPGLSEFVGLSSELHIFTDQALLPDWWKHGAGECRGSGGLATNFDFTSGPFTCADFYGGQAQGGFAFDVGYGAPNRARLRIQCAVPYDSRGQVEAGSEYYAYKVNLLRAKSAGPGS